MARRPYFDDAGAGYPGRYGLFGDHKHDYAMAPPKPKYDSLVRKFKEIMHKYSERKRDNIFKAQKLFMLQDGGMSFQRNYYGDDEDVKQFFQFLPFYFQALEAVVKDNEARKKKAKEDAGEEYIVPKFDVPNNNVTALDKNITYDLFRLFVMSKHFYNQKLPFSEKKAKKSSSLREFLTTAAMFGGGLYTAITLNGGWLLGLAGGLGSSMAMSAGFDGINHLKSDWDKYWKPRPYKAYKHKGSGHIVNSALFSLVSAVSSATALSLLGFPWWFAGAGLLAGAAGGFLTAKVGYQLLAWARSYPSQPSTQEARQLKDFLHNHREYDAPADKDLRILFTGRDSDGYDISTGRIFIEGYVKYLKFQENKLPSKFMPPDLLGIVRNKSQVTNEIDNFISTMEEYSARYQRHNGGDSALGSISGFKLVECQDGELAFKREEISTILPEEVTEFFAFMPFYIRQRNEHLFKNQLKRENDNIPHGGVKRLIPKQSRMEYYSDKEAFKAFVIFRMIRRFIRQEEYSALKREKGLKKRVGFWMRVGYLAGGLGGLLLSAQLLPSGIPFLSYPALLASIFVGAVGGSTLFAEAKKLSYRAHNWFLQTTAKSRLHRFLYHNVPGLNRFLHDPDAPHDGVGLLARNAVHMADNIAEHVDFLRMMKEAFEKYHIKRELSKEGLDKMPWYLSLTTAFKESIKGIKDYILVKKSRVLAAAITGTVLFGVNFAGLKTSMLAVMGVGLLGALGLLPISQIVNLCQQGISAVNQIGSDCYEWATQKVKPTEAIQFFLRDVEDNGFEAITQQLTSYQNWMSLVVGMGAYDMLSYIPGLGVGIIPAIAKGLISILTIAGTRTILNEIPNALRAAVAHEIEIEKIESQKERMSGESVEPELSNTTTWLPLVNKYQEEIARAKDVVKDEWQVEEIKTEKLTCPVP